MTKLNRISHHVLLVALGGGALLMAGCQDAPANRTRIYAVDMAGGAKSCTASAVNLAAGQTAPATMAVGNDGGWCGILVGQSSGIISGGGLLGGPALSGRKPFAAGLVQTRPQHGHVHIHPVGDETRVDYTPDRGFSGTDQFAVRLLPGNAVLDVAVTVAAK